MSKSRKFRIFAKLGSMPPDMDETTGVFLNYCQGDQDALNRLMPVLYEELRSLARSRLRHERPDHSMQTTALIHEAYVRLIDQQRVTWQSRSHFLGIAAQAMRRILVDHARGRLAAKRGAGLVASPLEFALEVAAPDGIDHAELDDALRALARVDAQQARVVELRFFGGLTVEETAEVIHVSPATIKRDWAVAKAWLYRWMTAIPDA